MVGRILFKGFHIIDQSHTVIQVNVGISGHAQQHGNGILFKHLFRSPDGTLPVLCTVVSHSQSGLQKKIIGGKRIHFLPICKREIRISTLVGTFSPSHQDVPVFRITDRK
ncbi:hypothetical protein SDC9_182068 [bioreactor metagenome]|uniref:Uncharacterized protein n=1 Tax=bioreactor metagenome TaxID=1076179 RepID=A0A645HEP5_9ZZZZ